MRNTKGLLLGVLLGVSAFVLALVGLWTGWTEAILAWGLGLVHDLLVGLVEQRMQ